MGDIAIYVAPGSVDQARASRAVQGRVAGGACRPTLSPIWAKLWGNPLYDWPAAAAARGIPLVGRALPGGRFELFDLARIDHFRGLRRVLGGAVRCRRRARRDVESAGRGGRVFDAASEALGSALPLVAEDLGVITPAVTRRAAAGSTRTAGECASLQFGFDPRRPARPAPAPRTTRRTRSSTRGRTTATRARGWYESLPRDQRLAGRRRACPTAVEPWWGLIGAGLVVTPRGWRCWQAQDVLGLGSEGAPMNMPGTRGGSWKWQMNHGALTGDTGEAGSAKLTEAADTPAAGIRAYR